jgi:hypothetical protein
MIGKSMGKKNTITLVLVTTAVLLSQPLWADAEDRRQAKRIHDRLTGVPASNATINAMETRLISDPTGKTAAEYAIDTVLNPSTARYFYNVTLKNFSAPWTNEEQTVFTPLNDYTATVIGLVRDESDFRQVLHGNVIYRGNNGVVPGLNTPYRNNDNAHYVQLEGLGPVAGDLSDSSILISDSQSSVTGLPSTATAGVMTSRAGAMSFFSDGTNRAMFRFTMMNHLCTDLEPLKDVSRTPDHVRRDVSRSPGGDSRIFLNSCIGCHAGMDGMAGAYAYYEWDYTNDKTTGRLAYRELANPKFDPVTGVSLKHNINENNFEYGHITNDDSWVNYWRNGQNWLLGWGPAVNPDAKGNETGSGAKSLGQELANSDAFAQCQVDKVFEAVCLRSPTEFFDDGVTRDRIERDNIVNRFKTTYNYNMREVFTDVAAHCKGN